MRRVSLLAALLVLGAAGVALADTTNTYVLFGSVTPVKSGSGKHGVSVAIRFGYKAGTQPAGQRPAPVVGYKISFEGVRQNTGFFPACGTSEISAHGPDSCPKGSEIGGGHLIAEIGPSANTAANYQSKCRAEIRLFNGGNNNLTMYIYKGKPVVGQPGPCRVANGHAEINIDLLQSDNGVSEVFSIPKALRHPAKGITASVIYVEISTQNRRTIYTTGKGSHTKHFHVGLFVTYFCPPNHQRQIAATFTAEGSQTVRTRTVLVPCKP